MRFKEVVDYLFNGVVGTVIVGGVLFGLGYGGYELTCAGPERRKQEQIKKDSAEMRKMFDSFLKTLNQKDVQGLKEYIFCNLPPLYSGPSGHSFVETIVNRVLKEGCRLEDLESLGEERVVSSLYKVKLRAAFACRQKEGAAKRLEGRVRVACRKNNCYFQMFKRKRSCPDYAQVAGGKRRQKQKRYQRIIFKNGQKETVFDLEEKAMDLFNKLVRIKELLGETVDGRTKERYLTLLDRDGDSKISLKDIKHSYDYARDVLHARQSRGR